MCGINGIFDCNGGKENYREHVKRMNASLAHRGPDDEGIFSEEGITLGHRRLSIIDLSPGGHQPMQYEHAGKKYTLIFNGELYNFRELKTGLSGEGFRFRTHSDTEVVLAAYAKWGTKCLDSFNGMFAFAIWSHSERTLFIARDRLGIKPLYFTIKDDRTIIFSSEVRALLASGLTERKIYGRGLDDFLHYQTVHCPASIVANVTMLKPGCFLLAGKEDTFYEEGEKRGPAIQSASWWPALVPREKPVTYAEACTTVRKLLREAVECRLVSDVPFGAFLSGGIDSGAIVALMSEVATAKVKTFSVTFDDSEFSEAVYARMIAKKFGTEHHEIKLSPDDFLHELPAALDAMDHPSGDGPNTFVVSKATKEAGITMALSGLGGDELFGGYEIFKRMVALEKRKWLWSLPLFSRKITGNFRKMMKPGVSSDKIAALMEMSSYDFYNAFMISRQVLSGGQIALITNGWKTGSPAPGKMAADATRSWHFDSPGQVLSRISVAEIGTYMQNVLLRDTDQMSMAHALEVRVPFLDYRLVEYVLSLPDEIKYPHTPKKLLVDSLGDLLPPEIVNRPKMGFTFPWKKWMKNELKSFCAERLEDLGKREPFDPEGISRLWNSFLRDDPRVTWSRIWPLVVLSHWLTKNGIES
ncbi:MAG TPA: asparagine synthase (glutamine-hydrolyzing) [Bacteroidia bacterium]|nr:asparagine synthase (glutamine-hydrolyzing) [Bacteroidia bacterium]